MNRNPNIHDFTQNIVEMSTIQGLIDEAMLDSRSLGFDCNSQIYKTSSKEAGNYIYISGRSQRLQFSLKITAITISILDSCSNI